MILSDEEDATNPMATAKVVEYLEPLMSKDLLCKFPDNSAFGFDYSQSSIWSPLIPRTHAPMDSDCVTPKKLLLHSGRKTKGASSVKKKITATAFKLNLRLMQSNKKGKKKKEAKKKKNFETSGFSPNPGMVSCLSFSVKGWNKVLGAAKKHFKKKRRDPMAHVKLCNYLEGHNI